MQNFSKRSLTSLTLIIIIYQALVNKYVLFFLLLTISYISLLELYNLIKKIFLKHKFLITIIYFLSIIYLIFFLTQLFFFINKDYNSKLLFIFLITICIATDIGGYTFGKFFKGKKLIKISPNKTYSGLIGSYLLSFAVFFYFYFQLNFSYSLLILTFFISSISQAGDLFFSFLKREAKLKDTGNLLPGHGGILDRIDGIIFAVPIGLNLLFFFK
tara:strand:+ start:3708 stop:4352 length:645 start_codon:yes stop_codon:yes gene_type:complete